MTAAELNERIPNIVERMTALGLKPELNGVRLGKLDDNIIYKCRVCGGPHRPHCDGSNWCSGCGHYHDDVSDGYQPRWWLKEDPNDPNTRGAL